MKASEILKRQKAAGKKENVIIAKHLKLRGRLVFKAIQRQLREEG